MLRMLRREREEGLEYGSCVETGECTVPCYVVWPACGSWSTIGGTVPFFRIRSSRSDASLYVLAGTGQPHRHRGFSTSPGPTAHRTAAEKRDEITDMRPVLRAHA
jgi:hypothetical protein